MTIEEEIAELEAKLAAAREKKTGELVAKVQNAAAWWVALAIGDAPCPEVAPPFTPLDLDLALAVLAEAEQKFIARRWRANRPMRRPGFKPVDRSARGAVNKAGPGFRMRTSHQGKSVNWPQRATRAEAEADLALWRSGVDVAPAGPMTAGEIDTDRMVWASRELLLARAIPAAVAPPDPVAAPAAPEPPGTSSFAPSVEAPKKEAKPPRAPGGRPVTPEKAASRARIDALLTSPHPASKAETQAAHAKAPTEFAPQAVDARPSFPGTTVFVVPHTTYVDPGAGYGEPDANGLAKHLICRGRGCATCLYHGVKRCQLRSAAPNGAPGPGTTTGKECRACGKRARPSCTLCAGTGYELDSITSVTG